ncbi:MarR family transcriptional regulator [Catenulispora sp. NL8]|uniref:MarR family transcriptional regulator n=1 Tax=Catenulispora pinistramenti TaxID=2705254 RepID=A0ABS5L523_9ACTN|nr:helix-turn-helix domain-containing protein [Catenulispora pinistramenti]MBS2553215.1 MarR family transcriptional regulator [Catenulispora pinistramenti]
MRKDDPARPTPDSDPLSAYIERFASVLFDSGIPRMPARVFAALITEDDGRLTSQQLSDRLDISPAAVSGAISYLSQIHLVTREREPGTRRDRYRVLDEVWQDAILQRDAMLARWEGSLAEGVTVVGADTSAGHRLQESVVMFQFLREEVSRIAERWQERRAALRIEVAARMEAAARAEAAARIDAARGAGDTESGD